MELNELIQSIDIVEYISQFVDLEQKGDEWWGLSCFKEENTPSFSVRKNPPFFFDYSSGVGGNLFTFVKRYNGCSNRAAVEIIKKYAGCDEEIAVRPGKMAATLDCKKFMPPKQEKSTSNGTILPSNYMERYEKRADKLSVWESEGISVDAMNKFEVFYDAFSDRLVYPIRNMAGEIVNIGGRTLDPDWKEKKLRKYTYFFHWGTMNVIYGLYEHLQEVRDAHEIILFEGCKSVLLAETWGIHNTGAILTSHLNPNQLKLLAGLGCRVVFALDKDVKITSDKRIASLKNYVNVDYIWDRYNLLDEKDSPVDKGKEVFEKLYAGRIHYK